MNPLGKLTSRWRKRLLAAAAGQVCPRDAVRFGLISFSQAAEDLVLYNLLVSIRRRPPFHYIDIGCFEAVRFSNTYFFYLLGGSGLVVDLRATHESSFRKFRPRDKFVCAAVSNSDTPVSILSQGRAFDKIGEGPNAVTVMPQSLASLLENHWFKSQSIDILDIDCEGSDLAVLRSNNWQKFRPLTLVVEDFHSPDSPEPSPITLFMVEHGYRQVLRLRNNSFFVDNSQVA